MTAALTLSSPVAVVMKAMLMEWEICNEIGCVVDTVQTAQLRLLSPMLLSGNQLHKLYSELTKCAEALQANLLLENPSDLLQIKVSFIYDSEESNDVTLILHVPMAQKCAILHLFRFLPFPLPFFDMHFLVPCPHHNLFAISSNEPRLSIDLTEADLEGCSEVSNVHLCEQLGILWTGHEGSCLGSLYAQQLKNTMARCQMDIVPISEQVLQLTDNWFLIYSPSLPKSTVWILPLLSIISKLEWTNFRSLLLVNFDLINTLSLPICHSKSKIKLNRFNGI